MQNRRELVSEGELDSTWFLVVFRIVRISVNTSWSSLKPFRKSSLLIKYEICLNMRPRVTDTPNEKESTE